MRENFFTDQNEGYASFPQQKQFAKTWNKVLAFEKSTGKTLDEGYTKDEYVELFNSMLVKKSSTFFNDKKAVLYYVRYMIAHGELQKEQEEILSSVMAEDLSISSKSARITYFKDLDHLRAAIEDTVFAANRIDDSVFDVPSAVLYLAWFGLTEEQILTLPKTAVYDDGIVLDGVKIEMPYFVTELLIHLRDAEGFESQGRGRIFRKYVYSENLIRTEDSPKVTVFQMRASLSRMDKYSNHEYSLKFDTARQSGIFYRAYMLEQESSNFDLENVEFASEVFCENLIGKNEKDIRKPHRERLRDYALYKQLHS